MKAFVNTKSRRPDGSYDSYLTQSVDVKECPLPWQEKGLSFTATGYGVRITTRYMVRWLGRWRRVYACQISNAGSLFIGKKFDPQLTVTIERC